MYKTIFDIRLSNRRFMSYIFVDLKKTDFNLSKAKRIQKKSYKESLRKQRGLIGIRRSSSKVEGLRERERERAYGDGLRNLRECNWGRKCMYHLANTLIHVNEDSWLFFVWCRSVPNSLLFNDVNIKQTTL